MERWSYSRKFFIVALWTTFVFLVSIFFEKMSQASEGSKVSSHQSSLYSETSISKRKENVANFTRVNTVLSQTKSADRIPSLQLYGEVGVNQSYQDSFVYPALGIRSYLNSYFTIFAESRYLNLENSKKESEWDGRGGGFFSQFNAWPISKDEVTKETSLHFVESFGEIVSSSRFKQNIFFLFQSKLGFRQKTSFKKISMDEYIGLMARRDAHGYYRENLEEISAGIRPKMKWSDLNLSLQVDYTLTYKEWKSLFVLAGDF